MSDDKRCGHCWLHVTGRKAFFNGKTFHYHCYMFRWHGVSVKAETEEEREVSDENPWGGSVDHYDAMIERELLAA